jgi:hypothetical protein
LGQVKTKIFLQEGLDSKSVICPSGKSNAGTDGIETALPVGERSHQPKRPLVSGRVAAHFSGVCLEVAHA